MRVLLTGATGNLGDQTLRELARQGHTVRCLVRDPRAGHRLTRLGKRGQVSIALGDVRDAEAVRAAVAGQETIIHLAAMLPPVADMQPELARAINVGGTEHVIAAAQAQATPPKLVYISSIAIFGNTQTLPPPRRVSDPIHPIDPYSKHKAECETLVRASGLTWTILRLTAIPRMDESFNALRIRAMFSVPPTDRMEMIHPADAALAVVNAISSPEVWGKTLIVAGGPACRMTMADYYRGYLDGAGIGTFDARYFGKESYHLDWYDTDESEALLHYQRHSAKDFFAEYRRRMTLARWGATLVRPFVRRALLRYAVSR